MKRFLTKRNIIVLIVILIIGGVWYAVSRGKADKSAVKKIVSVERKDITSVLTVSGKIAADQTVSLTFQTSGKLGFVKVKVGEIVNKGQVMAGLDMGDLDAAVNAAYYKYLAADANAKYVEDTVRDHDKDETYTQKNTRVAAQTARDMAYDAWLSARRARDNGYLISPFPGVVTASTISSAGDVVGITDGITVANPESLHFKAEIDESDVGKVKIGQKVRITLDAFSKKEFWGLIRSISFVSGLSSTGATVYSVDVEVADAGEVFRLGMNGDGDIQLASVSDVLTLPAEAVNDGKVIRENGEEQEVETGLEGVDEIEIIRGLNEGDKVIIK